MRESELHRWLVETLPPGRGVLVGVGDDAAVMAAEGLLAAACDLTIEGTHFTAEELAAGPGRVGAKAMNRNLSDLAAMGMRPRWALVSAAVPAGAAPETVRGVIEGIRRAGERFGVALVGGDTACSPGPWFVDVTVLGGGPGLEPVRRAGARPGDRILVTGELGGSSRGRHLDFVPRVEEGLFLARRHRPTAMIDISDGLGIDLLRLLDASGAGAEIDAGAIPVSADARELAAESGRDPLDHALGDGEDFELLFTLRPDRLDALLKDPDRGFPVTVIGRVTAPGRRVLRRAGRELPLAGQGYEHAL